ncbi:MAG: hypothetical protein ABIU30_07460 [Ferruginibacter sp.]
MIYEKLRLAMVELEIKKIFGNDNNGQKLNLTPDSIGEFAEQSGVRLKWRPIINWLECFQFNSYEYSDEDFLQIAFAKVKPSNGKTIVVTDECFQDNMAFLITQFKDMIYFMEHEYPRLFNMQFPQPSDFIFIQPQIKLITMIHHEGLRTKYSSS